MRPVGMARRKGNLTLAKEAGDGARCKMQLVVTSEDNIMKKEEGRRGFVVWRLRGEA